MSRNLIMDESKEIFTLNKEILSFKINQSNLSKLSSHSSIHSGNLHSISEEDILVTNLTSEYLAFRTKTTRKENYAVNPTYCVIPPNSTQNLNLVLYNRTGEKLDPKSHKFKFEGFIIPESQKDEDIKNLFKDYIKNGKKVIGNSQKRGVQFLEENDEGSNILRGSNNSLGNSNLSNYTVAEEKKNSLLMDKIQEKDENVRLSDIIEEKTGGRFGMENNMERLEYLKKEYNQLKEQVENLKRNEELLNKKIYIEKNKKNVHHGSDKFKFKVPEIKEEKLSRNKRMGIFLFSVLIGFYLVK